MPDGRGHVPLTAERWRRVCTVLDRVHQTGPESRDAILETACREHGLSVDDVKPFLAASEQSATLPENIPLELIENAFDDIAEEPAALQLATGQRLGPYEIVASLGAGGMGEVYRANDSRLDRTVAIKVLRPHLLQSAQARQRFEREARAIARLNHAHVCTLYDIGHHEGVDFLVMEYGEGETLEERLKRGAIPVAQAIRFGSQIADALDRAHRQGIVHRDLKPANIMLTRGGVKLLDFGLARLDVAAFADDQALIGTPQYMSPEQLQRRPADARSDIFACGAVLYEMLTGQRAFAGSSQASVIAGILEREPAPVSQLVSHVPAALDWTISRCLAKDPDDRWQSAADLKHHLNWIASGAESAQDNTRRSRSAPWIAASIAIASVAVATWLWTGRTVSSPLAAPSVFTIDPPAGTAFDATHAISPDGRRIAFTATRADGADGLWIRSLDSLRSQRITGSEGAAHPFWSPDSRGVGFFADRKLKKVDLTSGTVQIICDVGGGGGGGSWNRNDVILFSSAAGLPTGLWRVSALGGSPVPITPSEERGRDAWPQFLPDGQRFMYMRADRAAAGVYLGRLDSADPHVPIMKFASETPPTKAILADDVLFFLDQTTLMAQRVDAARMTLAGEPVRVAENIRFGPPGLAAFDAVPGGVVTYRVPASRGLAQLTWVDRNGRTIGRLGEPAPHVAVSLSPDGRLALVNEWDEGRPSSGTVKRVDIDTGAATTLFTNAAAPIWSPNGSQVVYTQFSLGRGAPPTPTLAALDGRAVVRPLADFGGQAHATDWSRDGRFIVGAAPHGETTWDIWIVDTDTGGAVRDFIREPFQQRDARISPDGRWLAYAATDARGEWNVYVRSFPDGGALRRVSTRGGRSPRWQSDGRQLYYVEPGGRLTRISIAAGSEFSPGAPALVFQHAGLTDASEVGFAYDVSPDGTRFLIGVPTSDPVPSTPLVVVLNWRFPASR